jgi:DHA1 family bicyclomycin/chloramphenicol resistance-like MFS transporter
LYSWTLTITLAGLAMIGAFSVDTFLPSFHAIGTEFGVGLATVQQTLSAYLLAFSFMSLFYGTLSDAFGRRPVILVSLVMFTLASAGAAFAPSFGWLLVFRVLQGLSAGAGRVVGQAIVRDRFQGADAQRLMAHITMVFGLAPAIAPVMGGYLQAAFGWRSVFFFLTLVGAVLLLATWRGVAESLPPAGRIAFHPAILLRNYGRALRHPRFLAGALAVSCAFGGQAIYIASGASYVVNILGLPETAFAWLFVPMIGGLVIGSAASARLASRMAPARVIWLGMICLGVAALANVGYNSLLPPLLPWCVLPMMLFAFGLGLSLPSMNLATLDIFPEMRGLCASLVTFIQMLVFTAISGLVAPLVFDSALLLGWVELACFLLALACWTYASRRSVK